MEVIELQRRHSIVTRIEQRIVISQEVIVIFIEHILLLNGRFLCLSNICCPSEILRDILSNQFLSGWLLCN